jgi:ornithine decarboxylase
MSPSAISTISTTSSFSSIDSFFEHTKNSYLDKNDHGVNIPKKLIGEALKQRVESIDQDVCEAGEEDTFFVADLGEVYRQHMRWKKNLPRVKPFYGGRS